MDAERIPFLAEAPSDVALDVARRWALDPETLTRLLAIGAEAPPGAIPGAAIARLRLVADIDALLRNSVCDGDVAGWLRRPNPAFAGSPSPLEAMIAADDSMLRGLRAVLIHLKGGLS